MQTRAPLVFVAWMVLAVPASSSAIDLRHFGFGVTTLHPVNPTPPPMARAPAALLSVRFTSIPRVEIGGMFGFASGDGFLIVVPGARGNFVLFDEKNSNFYVAAQLSASVPVVGFDQFYVNFFVGPGIEFRIPGLEEIEFFTDFGVAGFIGNSLHLSTSGHLMGMVGFHYYLGASRPAPPEEARPEKKPKSR